MNKVTKFAAALTALAAFAGSVSAQSFAIAIEEGQLLDPTGATVAPGGANLFYAIVPGSFDLGVVDALFPTVEEAGRLVGDPAINYDVMDLNLSVGFSAWTTAGSPALLPIAVGQKPIVVITDAADAGSIGLGSALAVIEGDVFQSTLENRFSAISSFIPAGGLTTVVGLDGSIQMVNVVPEPSTYALIGGLLALGFVAYRRRR